MSGVMNSHDGIGIIKDKQFGWRYGGRIWLHALAGNPKWPIVSEALADALRIDPGRLEAALKIAFEHWQDEQIINACGGNLGPVAGQGVITFEDYQSIIIAYENERQIIAATKNAKRAAMRSRRSEFQSQRDALVLALLDTGVPYKCNHPGCNIVERLTLDHMLPLSRGGTDELSNLQFLCLGHNSAKGDRI